MQLSTPAFDEGESIPDRYTCSGADVSPELHVDGVPERAESLALVVDDPDAPDGVFTHWLLWNVSPDADEIPANVPQERHVLDDAVQGTNDFGEIGYRGPCPPTDHGAHAYRFTLYACDRSLDVAPGSERGLVSRALEDAAITRSRLTAEFERE